MSAHKLKPKDLAICNKCGNVMVNRKIRVNHSNEVGFQKVLQCIVCRHWVTQD
ncbi:MAG: hypothetical protein ACFE9S_08025 [Candidatus Hermodarchaeota archaeon]